MKNAELIERDQAHLIHPLHHKDVQANGHVWVRAEGAKSFREAGIDGFAQLVVVDVGAAEIDQHPRVVALAENADLQDEMDTAMVGMMIWPRWSMLALATLYLLSAPAASIVRLFGKQESEPHASTEERAR